MNVFELRNRLIGDFGAYVQSFFQIEDDRIRAYVQKEIDAGLLWPNPLIQLNPFFEPGESIEELVANGTLHRECARVFRRDKDKGPSADDTGKPLRLHRHQADAVKTARTGANYVLTTGTGSGKSLAYIVPIVDHVLRNGSGRGIQAVVVYPMNALANSQEGELRKFLADGYPDGRGPVTFARYTGQEKDEERKRITANPPDVLLTNFVMLELILTRQDEKALVRGAQGLRFLVLDELHTYRGRQGADVAMLVRRVREAFSAPRLQCIGTSATIAGPGSPQAQKKEVADVVTRLFGAPVLPENVIGETLRRATPEKDVSDQSFLGALRQRVTEAAASPPTQFDAFIQDPLSIWIESVLGVEHDRETGLLRRAKPRSIHSPDGVAVQLSTQTGAPVEVCASAVEAQLLASYSVKHPESGFPVFAFRLHQFLSRGDTVYASLEDESTRALTVQGQQFVPGSRDRILLPLVFCRECGQEYCSVQLVHEAGQRRVKPRNYTERDDGDHEQSGYLFSSATSPWPTEPAEILERIPPDWIEDHKGSPRVRRDRREQLPESLNLDPSGLESERGRELQFLRAPFRFCLSCGVTYGGRARSDFGKLATLGTEGRSTATTILCLSTIRELRRDGTLDPRARKLLSFTDNRQDASLQAGHFNDFVEVGLVRSALYRAVAAAGAAGLRHDDIVQKVFETLSLSLDLYALDPTVRFQALEETRATLRRVLGYRVYRDMERGWRITSPNLEQCGLIEIHYQSLEDLCRSEEDWKSLHPALAGARPETRESVAKTLLDFMRRELALQVEYLDPQYQERLRTQSFQKLKEPWAFDEEERLQAWKTLWPRSERQGDPSYHVFLSPLGAFGQFLRRRDTLPNHGPRIEMDEAGTMILQLLECLRIAGLVQRFEAQEERDVPGYRVKADGFIWIVGKGEKSVHDPIRVPRAPKGGGRANRFFVDYYRTMAADGAGLEAREHTAQVDSDRRQDREARFREGTLPILFCSPTMELGVDIAELNVVNLRNVPPTPANYAQRSGRAGRSGQPALVFSYCSSTRSHDQYFFRRPDRMVGGAVAPPRIDIANQDLVRAHVQAVWLGETGLSLGKSLKDLLDIEGDRPSLSLVASVRAAIDDEPARTRALARAQRVLETVLPDLRSAGWYSESWLSETLAQVGLEFDRACERWRALYRAAKEQFDVQNRVIGDAARSQDDKQKARQLRAEAEAQMNLLVDAQSAIEADFYSYRYFASEGFLPGYNFPRLPLSAYIPGRRERVGRDRRGTSQFVSRPRFLAVSEFGPRAVVYHEGARFKINRVILPARGEGEEGLTVSLKQCVACGYLHPLHGHAGPDLCQRCGVSLGMPMVGLFRLQNVSTRRIDRINSDEEERLRLGYELRSGVRYADQDGQPVQRKARAVAGSEEKASLEYGHAATIWRINLGWTRRANPHQYGFVLDLERGYWQKDERDEEEVDDPLSARRERVVPFVEDRKNSLLVEPHGTLDLTAMASLQAALKTAIQVEFQLEESELAAEPLPGRDLRRLLLFYEAAEGGAGVLRRLLDDPDALARVARRALEICHFDPDSGQDLRRHPRSREDCEAACYDCLMSYSNQLDHELLDRHRIRDVLLGLANARVEASSSALSRAEHLAGLLRLCQSELERDWLRLLDGLRLRLPEKAQPFIEACSTRPDFFYEEHHAAIYIDGPHHEFPERKARDAAQTTCMEDVGYSVIRFAASDDWAAVVAAYPGIFGRARK